MNKKIILILIASLIVIFSLGVTSAAQPTYNDESAPCYACNSTECHCKNTCLCKDPNFENITAGETKIRNENGCYYCNESCDCPENCSCKHPKETSRFSGKGLWHWWESIINYIINIPNPNNQDNNTGTNNTNNTTIAVNNTNNTTDNDTLNDTNTSEENIDEPTDAVEESSNDVSYEEYSYSTPNSNDYSDEYI